MKLIYILSALLITTTVCFAANESRKTELPANCDKKCLASCYSTLDKCSTEVNEKYDTCVRDCGANLECQDTCEKNKKDEARACQEGYESCRTLCCPKM